MSNTVEIPWTDYQAIYAENQAALQATTSSCDAYLTAYVDNGPNSEVCFFANPLKAVFSPAWMSYIVTFSGMPIDLPAGVSEQRFFRVHCNFVNPSVNAAMITGICRVPMQGQAMSMIQFQNTRLFIHALDGKLGSLFLAFPASYEQAFQEQLSYMGARVPSVATISAPAGAPAAVDAPQSQGANTEQQKVAETNGVEVTRQPKENKLGPAAPPPLSLHLSREFFPVEVQKDAWRMLEDNGAIFDQRLMKEEADPKLCVMVLDSVIKQNIFLKMLKVKTMQPSVSAMLKIAESQGRIPQLMSTVDYASLATSDEELFDLAAIGFLDNEVIRQSVVSSLAPLVCQRIRDAPFARNLGKLLQNPVISKSTDSSLVSMLLKETVQSPVYLTQAACDVHGSQVLLLTLNEKNQDLLADASRSFGFGRKRMVLTVGLNEHGSKVLAQLIKASSRDDILPLFDFRDALNDSIKRLAVHPHGAKVAKECLDHSFFRENAVLRLYYQDVHDMIHRSFPLLEHGIQTEQDASKKKLLVEVLIRRIMFLNDQDKSKLDSLRKAA